MSSCFHCACLCQFPERVASCRSIAVFLSGLVQFFCVSFLGKFYRLQHYCLAFSNFLLKLFGLLMLLLDSSSIRDMFSCLHYACFYQLPERVAPCRSVKAFLSGLVQFFCVSFLDKFVSCATLLPGLLQFLA